ncbi:flagellar hook-basal body complex protein FliE [bacterium]|jgi:flagellar hook-basal body complex protein FliE|nr:flagellar hook-basal body complex protein FliE [Verrucomicrobiota bacterium]MDB4663319.1 flagellar hook-basal body complex protein FliE [bacterium]MDB4688965.1 flagellar hook-basal body complex protein FliE [Verrucomicrobiota bacterium]MDB4777746.1 flagellar hook-basal body complex protein FliE [Verrucomicrobiota bacterium]
MEGISQATNIMNSAMQVANQSAQQPDSFLPASMLEQADQIKQAISANDSLQTSQATATGEAGTSFANMLKSLAQDVSVKSAQAGEAVQGVLAGEGVPLHQAVIAAEEASVSFQLMVEVRNKLLESYQELMRMQV